MKRQFKVQASSSRALSGGGFGAFGTFGTDLSSSALSYLTEPPNISSISDSNVVVAFKNLSKKDGTTKSKALEDLRAYVLSHPFELAGGTEETILDAWVQFYPRIAIDNSRRVRELSHHVQYELLKSARKRMEKHIPKVVGTWLAGTYDRDRAVARAAQAGIASFLDTEQKISMFWKRCQSQILEYAQAALNETSESLSDERTMSVDDMQAKYFRVVGSSVHLVLNLLIKLDHNDIHKQQDKYDGFLLGNKKLWALASCEDPFVRRSVDQLLLTCISKQISVIDLDKELLSSAFIGEALKVPQSGSAYQLLQVLSALTKSCADIWTSSYKGRRSSLHRIRSFIERGSQGGPPEFWLLFQLLLSNLPIAILPNDAENSVEFLKAVRKGISNREEPRNHAPQAWSSYFLISKYLAENLSDSGKTTYFLQEAFYPVFEQYLFPNAENSQWSVGNTAVLAKGYWICYSIGDKGNQTALASEWDRLAETLISRLQTSLPAQSKDYRKSQDSIKADADRWFGLLGTVLQLKQSTDETDFVGGASRKILEVALKILGSRNGKPYSAAAAVENALRLAPSIFHDLESLQLIKTTLDQKLLDLIISPSSTYLVNSLFLIESVSGQDSFFSQLWQSTITGLLALSSGHERSGAIAALLASSASTELSHNDTKLQNFLFEESMRAIMSDSGDWQLVEVAVSFDSLTAESLNQVLNHALENLECGRALENTFRILELISNKRPELLRTENIHVALLSKLLALTELSDTAVISKAANLRAVLEGSDTSTEADQARKSPILHIIRQNLETANSQSLSINTLVQQATSVIESSSDLSNAISLFPNTLLWLKELQPFLEQSPDPSLAVMRPFAGTLFVIDQPQKSSSVISRDLNGYSVALRMAMYVAALISSKAFDSISRKSQVDTLYLLCLTAELVKDQVDLSKESDLFELNEDSRLEEVLEFRATVQSFLTPIISSAKSWRRNSIDAIIESQDSSALMHELIFKLIQSSTGRTTTSYYAAKTLAFLLRRLVDEHGWQAEGGDEWLLSLGIMKFSESNAVVATAILTGLEENLGSSKLVNNLCNRLISDVAGLSAEATKTLPLVVFLNSALAVYDEGDLPVAQNRIVFAIKQILSWSNDLAFTNARLAAEACRALQRLLPAIKDVYGSYWETALSLCVSIWEGCLDGYLSGDRLPMIGMSLKLVSILHKLKDANDDLEDSLQSCEEKITTGLLGLLKLRRTKENLPLEFVDNLISRLVVDLPRDMLGDPTEFYPLIASSFRIVQSTAYGILHSRLPKAQEQISVDVLLEKRDAQFPEELLSLLLDAPSTHQLPDVELSRFPSSVRSYLLSWHLVFESYPPASYKVRNDYSNILKTENYINPLLDFLFDALGHSTANAINLDKARYDPTKIRNYNIWEAVDTEPEEQQMQWLMINVYFLALKYTPNLVKNWWVDCPSKQTRIAVEAWTAKYFSPLVIQDTLEEVSQWASEQETTSEDEKELIVKVSKRSREVLAGYEIDELMMQIAVRLPANYPLEGVKVEGVNRVAVSEKKWTSWLMITQGVVTFSNGSLTDGLTIFRKNVTGALKGQTECAICYSIISSDKKMPEKRCQTCKNLFHSGCLFKWFASSNQSTCPLCRNPFNYGSDISRRNRERE